MSQEDIDEGLRYVNNDSCYPAIIIIGQILSALKSGKYDLKKTAVLMTQTGGPCRASNYLALLDMALQKNGLKASRSSPCPSALQKNGPLPNHTGACKKPSCQWFTATFS